VRIGFAYAARLSENDTAVRRCSGNDELTRDKDPGSPQHPPSRAPKPVTLPEATMPNLQRIRAGWPDRFGKPAYLRSPRARLYDANGDARVISALTENWIHQDLA